VNGSGRSSNISSMGMSRLAGAGALALCACSLAGGGGGPPRVPPTPCSGDATLCLAGTASLAGFDAGVSTPLQAKLFREYPLAGSTSLAKTPVAYDGTWTFSALPAWEHYFVQVAADFGQPVAVAGVAGPLGVPVAASAAPTPVTVKPVELTVVQQALSGGPMQAASALAVVFDPGTGAPVSGASVTLGVGGAQVPMPEVQQSGVPTYSVTLPASTPAQATYSFTVVSGGNGKTSTWQVTAGTASYQAALASPLAGATVPKGQPLAVSWPAQPAADVEVLELFTQGSGGAWVSTWTSTPHDADATGDTIPGAQVTAGQPLLLNVAFAAAGCAAGGDGCVLSDQVAAAQITAQ
jgi:hypothetical protein